VCSIQRHILCLIWTSIGCCLVLLHRSSLEIISGHLMLRMRLRQVLKKVCIFFMDAFVVLHVSDPYNSTDLTFELRIRNLVEIRISFDAQMFLSMMNTLLSSLTTSRSSSAATTDVLFCYRSASYCSSLTLKVTKRKCYIFICTYLCVT